jgi:hypothetical protein
MCVCVCVWVCVCTYIPTYVLTYIRIHTHIRMDNSRGRSVRGLIDGRRQTDGWANGRLFGLIDKHVDR